MLGFAVVQLGKQPTKYVPLLPTMFLSIESGHLDLPSSNLSANCARLAPVAEILNLCSSLPAVSRSEECGASSNRTN